MRHILTPPCPSRAGKSGVAWDDVIDGEPGAATVTVTRRCAIPTPLLAVKRNLYVCVPGRWLERSLTVFVSLPVLHLTVTRRPFTAGVLVKT